MKDLLKAIIISSCVATAIFLFMIAFAIFGLFAVAFSGQKLTNKPAVNSVPIVSPDVKEPSVIPYVPLRVERSLIAPNSVSSDVKKFPSLTTTLGGSKEFVELTSSVDVVDVGFKYTYVYKNAGKEMTWLVGASMPDCASGFFGDMPTHYYTIAPGKVVTISVVHNTPPVESKGTLILYRKTMIPGFEEWYKQHQVKVDTEPSLYFQMQGGTNGWLPTGVSK